MSHFPDFGLGARPLRACALTGVLAWLAFSGLVSAGEPAVTIEVTPPVILHRTYDAEHPTDDPPDLVPPEVGLCVSEFGCEMRMTTSTAGDRVTETKIESIRMVTRLKITVWTRVLAPEREVKHEEGHRAISEYYYGSAETVARRLADEVVGHRLFRMLRKSRATPVEGTDSIQAACDALQGQLLEEYLAQTHWRCTFAQECFDAITDHGQNEIGEAEAVARAIAEEQAHCWH